MIKKRAFTMVELIFVIVILGILAAVAVPRLAASREDAEVARLQANIRQIAADLEGYFLANGKFEGYDPRKFTNVPLSDNYNYAPGNWSYFLMAGDVHCLGVSTDHEDAYSFSMPLKSLSDSSVCKRALCDEKMRSLFQGTRGYSNESPQNLISNPSLCLDPLPTSGTGWMYKVLSSNVSFD